MLYSSCFSLSRSLPLFLSFWLLVFALVSLVPMDFTRDARHFFGVACSSFRCCFAAGKCFWCSLLGMLFDALSLFLEISVCQSLSISIFVLWLLLFGCVWLCLAVFLLILWISGGALGRFSVRFCGLFVLLCLAVLLVAGASGALLSECC